ncbi:DUF4442 domain-containing protein [Ornithinimicrobium tianjinense]|uniref:DUF4442 domain-containing protein n=1 Tax=Ornithinimicrobium tianjinense TaxID=1195761 RepID=A0A917F949_9MICO|nr:DUF4442 domain-containing protein [Ornithinimicrobium tianjinense]GGF56904.1 DUF4442 domain-containing protein [Ornithinimicrobium tianjinense]
MSNTSTAVGRAQRVGRLKALASTPTALRHGMNLWPPFLFTGIRVEHIGADWRSARVRLAPSPLTSNYVGTLFGGSLFSMTDPFWMFLILRHLGPGYVVWDKAAEIEFVSPGRTSVTATFELTDEVLDELREAAVGGAKVLRWFSTDVVADDGTVVARVRKQIYVREARP